jgi:hypothetical protein
MGHFQKILTVLETGDIKNGKGDESTERSAIYRYAQIWVTKESHRVTLPV